MQVRSSTIPAMIRISVDGRLAEDRLCHTCGYNLRTLHIDSHCPECNAPVAESLVGTELVYADPAWLLTIRRGVKLMAVAVTSALALFAATFLFAITLPRGAAGFGMVLGPAFMALPVLFLIGLFMLTRREPRFVQQAEGFTARRGVRIFAAAALALMGLVALLRFATGGSVLIDQIMVYAPRVTTLLISIMLWVLADYFLALMKRTAAEKVVKSMKGIRSGVRVAVLIWVIQQGLGLALASRTPAATQPVESLAEFQRILANCGSCVALITFFLAASGLWKVHGVLHEAYAEAAARDRAIARANSV